MFTNFITITTPENIEIRYRLAGLGSRMAAASIDFCIIFTALLLVATAVFFTLFGGQLELVRDYSLNSWFTGLLLITGFGVYFGYFIVSELTMKGQTIGKKILKLRVILQNGQPVTLFPSLARNLFRYFLDMYGVGVIFMFMHRQYKRVGDIAAGTIVIIENPSRISLEQLTPLIPPEERQLIINNRYAVSEDELALLKEYFSRKDNLLDGGQELAKRLDTYFSKKFGVEPGKFNDFALEKILELNIRAARY